MKHQFARKINLRSGRLLLFLLLFTASSQAISFNYSFDSAILIENISTYEEDRSLTFDVLSLDLSIPNKRYKEGKSQFPHQLEHSCNSNLTLKIHTQEFLALSMHMNRTKFFITQSSQTPFSA